jgi:hypothetical protein
MSMPGLMDTSLKLGLNENSLAGPIEATRNSRLGWDARR